MGMVVRTNTMATNAYRQLGLNNSAVAKSLEKLASGYRINRAGDDAAGLAISEKMKAQITGLETASANAQDGISLIQTAEGNLSEVHDMLNRMVELATKSANGTYTQTERDALQAEVDQLLDEVDRISKSANFNGAKLLDGTMGLNTDAFKIGDSTAYTDGKLDVSKYLAADGSASPILHYGKAVAQEEPSFSIDLADLKIDKGTTVAGDTSTIKVTVAGKTFETAALAGAADQEADDIVTSIMGKASNFLTAGTDAPTGKTAVDIGGALFEVAGNGTKLNFTYLGLTSKGKDALATDEFDSTVANAVNTAIGTGVTIDKSGVNAKASVTGEQYHNTYKVEKAVAKVDAGRAGIDVNFDADLVKVGNSITIDGKTFNFVALPDDGSKKISDGYADDTTIYIDKNASSAQQIEDAVEQMSHKTTTNFEFEAKDGTTIHAEQTVASYNGGTKSYATYGDLVKGWSVSGTESNATTKLTLSNNAKLVAGDSINIAGQNYTFVKNSGDLAADSDAVEVVIGDTDKDTLTNLAGALKGVTGTVDGDTITITAASKDDSAPAVIGGGLTLQIGDTADSFNKMNVSVANMSAKGLGLDGLKITKESLASDAIDTIKTAINTVSSQRADLGALQNRLEHTINNLDVAAENLSAANSRIRDTDMAKEMMNYTKMNVLVQSAQAMLAQANQQPQSVLQLLQ